MEMLTEEEIQLVHDWNEHPLNSMNLSPDDEAFVKAEDLYVCTAYIDMIRVHTQYSKGANTPCIWQTSAFDAIIGDMFQEENFTEKFERLRQQFQNFIVKLRSLSEEERKLVYTGQMPLFS